jgi:hypothetical protein
LREREGKQVASKSFASLLHVFVSKNKKVSCMDLVRKTEGVVK